MHAEALLLDHVVEAQREKAAISRDYTDEELSAIAHFETLLRTYRTLRDLSTDLFGDGSPQGSL